LGGPSCRWWMLRRGSARSGGYWAAGVLRVGGAIRGVPGPGSGFADPPVAADARGAVVDGLRSGSSRGTAAPSRAPRGASRRRRPASRSSSTETFARARSGRGARARPSGSWKPSAVGLLPDGGGCRAFAANFSSRPSRRASRRPSGSARASGRRSRVAVGLQLGDLLDGEAEVLERLRLVAGGVALPHRLVGLSRGRPSRPRRSSVSAPAPPPPAAPAAPAPPAALRRSASCACSAASGGGVGEEAEVRLARVAEDRRRTRCG
jgi:hypothetical protein